MKFSINDFFSKGDQIRRKLRIWSHLLKKSLTENFNILRSVLFFHFSRQITIFIFNEKVVTMIWIQRTFFNGSFPSQVTFSRFYISNVSYLLFINYLIQTGVFRVSIYTFTACFSLKYAVIEKLKQETEKSREKILYLPEKRILCQFFESFLPTPFAALDKCSFYTHKKSLLQRMFGRNFNL